MTSGPLLPCTGDGHRHAAAIAEKNAGGAAGPVGYSANILASEDDSTSHTEDGAPMRLLFGLFPWLRLPREFSAAWRNRPPAQRVSARWPSDSWGDIVGPGWGESFKRMFDD